MHNNFKAIEREKVLKRLGIKGNFQIGLGAILVLWNMLIIIAAIETRGDDISITIALILFLLAFVIWGAFLIRSGIQKRTGVKIFESYRLRFYGKEDALNIDYHAMSSQMSKDLADIKKEVSLLIKLRLWEHVYGGAEAVKHSTIDTMMSKITVTCNSCHGTTSVNINNRGARCQYCGASLTDEMHQMMENR